MQHIKIVRYVINGILATALHFSVLQINLKILAMSSAGLANFVAAFFGITVSFVGNRYFVFKNYQQTILHQASMFGGVYTITTLSHGMVLYWWSDLEGWDYRTGFLLATTIQIFLGYWGSKLLVFKR